MTGACRYTHRHDRCSSRNVARRVFARRDRERSSQRQRECFDGQQRASPASRRALPRPHGGQPPQGLLRVEPWPGRGRCCSGAPVDRARVADQHVRYQPARSTSARRARRVGPLARFRAFSSSLSAVAERDGHGASASLAPSPAAFGRRTPRRRGRWSPRPLRAGRGTRSEAAASSRHRAQPRRQPQHLRRRARAASSVASRRALPCPGRPSATRRAPGRPRPLEHRRDVPIAAAAAARPGSATVRSAGRRPPPARTQNTLRAGSSSDFTVRSRPAREPVGVLEKQHAEAPGRGAVAASLTRSRTSLTTSDRPRDARPARRRPLGAAGRSRRTALHERRGLR